MKDAIETRTPEIAHGCAIDVLQPYQPEVESVTIDNWYVAFRSMSISLAIALIVCIGERYWGGRKSRTRVTPMPAPVAGPAVYSLQEEEESVPGPSESTEE